MECGGKRAPKGQSVLIKWQQLLLTLFIFSLKLLSCSMDKSLILWTPSNEEVFEASDGTGIWNETVRVGEVGGNSLGFLGCAISQCGSYLIGYSFTGSLHLWQNRQLSDWEPSVVPGGHFGPVEDLDWDVSGR